MLNIVLDLIVYVGHRKDLIGKRNYYQDELKGKLGDLNGINHLSHSHSISRSRLFQ